MIDRLPTIDPIVLIDRRIASAMAALHGARASAEHCPSGDNELVCSMCERTLNELLDQRWELTSAHSPEQGAHQGAAH